jgi:acetyl-CoA carboxylase biotin carboxyl carrier protein
MMDFQQIQELIKLVNKSKLSAFVLKEGDFKLIIKAQNTEDNLSGSVSPTVIYPAAQAMVMPNPQNSAIPAAAPAHTDSAPVAPPTAVAAPTAATNTKEIKSPMVGTFYRSAGPDKPQFVKIGDEIEIGQTVCIIEAMKLFNELESDIKGKLVKVFVEDGKPVEYDQPLFLVEIA